MMKFLTLTLDLLTRITLTLTSSFAIIGCFQKVNFQEFDLVLRNFELPFAFLRHVSYWENRLFYAEI